MTEGAAKPKSWRERAIAISQIRWLRRTVISIATALILFTIVGFFIIPLVVRHILKVDVAHSLTRPVDAGKITFNPYTLRLEVSHLHVENRDSPTPFVDLPHLHVRASWATLYHLAPVIRELTLTQPQVYLVRTAPQRFNFSDLLERPSAPPLKKPAKPYRFAISNIRIINGDIKFDDRVLNQQHQIQHIQLGIPFIANLPSDIEISVKPLLQMNVDGSPIGIAGKAKPFVNKPESVMNLKVEHFALPRYMGYVPLRLPIKVPSGALSAELQIHFVKTEPVPSIAVAGRVTLDQLAVNDMAGAPLVGFNQLVVPLNDIEPLAKVYRVGAIKLDGLTINAVLNPNGTTNFTALSTMPKTAAGSSAGVGASPMARPSPIVSSGAQAPAVSLAATPGASPAVAPTAAATVSASPLAQAAASPTVAASASVVATPNVATVKPPAPITPAPAQAAATPEASPAMTAGLPQSITAPAAPAASASPAPSTAAPEHPLDFTLDSFTLSNGTVNVDDRALPAPVKLALHAIQANLANFAIGPQAEPAPYSFA
ncbi:MAG TPA: DUF748 domain-containing protein, partial [Candidatus Binataceae bacterium]|nr:DUF748 domain-containing protein [Candidatus Binataceae bacterium]